MLWIPLSPALAGKDDRILNCNFFHWLGESCFIVDIFYSGSFLNIGTLEGSLLSDPAKCSEPVTGLRIKPFAALKSCARNTVPGLFQAREEWCLPDFSAFGVQWSPTRQMEQEEFLTPISWWSQLYSARQHAKHERFLELLFHLLSPPMSILPL